MGEPDKNDIEDILDLTETESSSEDEPAVFQSSPLIMDVHEVSKDSPPAPASATSDAQRQSSTASNKTKVKKIKKKKKKSPSQATMSSESASEASVSPVPAVKEEPAKEEFYDAHESYHTIGGVSENPALPTAALGTAPPLAPGVVAKPVEQTTAPPVVPAVPPVAVGLVQSHSEQMPASKTQSMARSSHGQPAEARKGPAMINKPANNPPE